MYMKAVLSLFTKFNQHAIKVILSLIFTKFIYLHLKQSFNYAQKNYVKKSVPMKFWPLRILIILSPSPNSPLPFLKFSSLRFFCTSLASCQLCRNRLEVSLISLPSSTSRMEGDEFQYNTHVKTLMRSMKIQKKITAASLIQ